MQRLKMGIIHNLGRWDAIMCFLLQICYSFASTVN